MTQRSCEGNWRTAPIRTCKEVGAQLGITGSAVWMAEQKALAKVRAAIERDEVLSRLIGERDGRAT